MTHSSLFVEAFKAVKVGDPMDMQTQMGSQINKRQLERFLAGLKLLRGRRDGSRGRRSCQGARF